MTPIKLLKRSLEWLHMLSSVTITPVQLAA